MGQRVEGKWDGVTPERLFVGVTEDCFSHAPPSGTVKIGLGFDHGIVAGHQAALLVAFRDTHVWVLDEHINDVSTSPEEDAAAAKTDHERHLIEIRVETLRTLLDLAS